jgi:putative hydrolase of the HAD superfamily
MAGFDLIGFDGDDTLWHNERLFVHAQDRFKQLLGSYLPMEGIDERLYRTEMRNLPQFGYGIKGFALSMIETAVELTEGRIGGADVHRIVGLAKEMMAAEVELLPHVAETVETLAKDHELMLVTKGDLHDQEKKVDRSGLAGYFGAVEIVSDKSSESYAALLQKHRVAPGRFLMIGNSLRSDILPVLTIGGCTVHIPHELTWTHEVADPPPAGHPCFHALTDIRLLPDLVTELEHGGRRTRSETALA